MARSKFPTKSNKKQGKLRSIERKCLEMAIIYDKFNVIYLSKIEDMDNYKLTTPKPLKYPQNIDNTTKTDIADISTGSSHQDDSN